MSENGQGYYYSVIPAPVLMNQNLRDKTKLTYGVIAGMLTKDKGYCFASNEALAARMRCGERSITRAISELVEAGELVVRYAGKERQIYTRETAARSLAQTGEVANLGDDSLANLGEALNKVEKLYNTPTSPPRGARVPSRPKWKPERFEKFWTFYRTHCRGEKRDGAVRAWDKLRPDDALIEQIGKALLAQLASDDWQRGIGIPYASSYLNGRRWEDTGRAEREADKPPAAPEAKPEEAFGVWH